MTTVAACDESGVGGQWCGHGFVQDVKGRGRMVGSLALDSKTDCLASVSRPANRCFRWSLTACICGLIDTSTSPSSSSSSSRSSSSIGIVWTVAFFDFLRLQPELDEVETTLKLEWSGNSISERREAIRQVFVDFLSNQTNKQKISSTMAFKFFLILRETSFSSAVDPSLFYPTRWEMRSKCSLWMKHL
ncbi:hypothetical protein F0562_022659 [Nyssa sinensis]|uniref:Uncharacterized protein n=1 Tax=Nyssa sinensis TaxID=561372 RepID=A0A5J5BI79_9ASTE|nr:hypothetical protein F0562_022659 [Nyssa sinensis]